MQTYTRLAHPDVPPDQRGNPIYGTLMHLGSPGLFAILLAIYGVSLWSVFITFMVVGAIFTPLTLLTERYDSPIHPAPPTRKEIWDGIFMVYIKGVLAGGGFVMAGWWLLSQISPYEHLSNSGWVILAGTVGTDFCYYLIHRFLSHGDTGAITKYYRRKHAYHHAVTALDFLRGNQSSWVDTSFGQFQPSIIVLSWLFGMDLPATLAAYLFILTLQATDHTSVTYNIGWLRYIFMDNHSHKFHHCIRGNLVNHAAAFSVFDRAFGTFYEDWSISPNYLHLHKMPIPIKALAKNKDE